MSLENLETRQLLVYHTRLRNVGVFTSVAVALVVASHVLRDEDKRRSVDLLLVAGLVFAATPVVMRFCLMDDEAVPTHSNVLPKHYALLTLIVLVDAALALHVLHMLLKRQS